MQSFALVRNALVCPAGFSNIHSCSLVSLRSRRGPDLRSVQGSFLQQSVVGEIQSVDSPLVSISSSSKSHFPLGFALNFLIMSAPAFHLED